MLNEFDSKIIACGAIADVVGDEYFKQHYKDACEAYTEDSSETKYFEYFLGFEGDSESGNWNVFAKVLVDRETKEVSYLDYKTPNGKRMENPPKPISFV